MTAAPNDLFRAWTDLTLMGVRAYSGALLGGLDMASRMVQPKASFPSPAILRRRPAEIWPVAGSFGGGTNAVAAWTETASAMMGVPTARMPGAMFNPFAWMMPQPASAQMFNPLTWMMPQQASSLMTPWLAGAMSPMASAPMAMWGRALGLPGTMPGFGWPMPGLAMPFAPLPGMADPFRMFTMMMPMLEAFAPKLSRRSSYH